jgi:hypothetical protein
MSPPCDGNAVYSCAVNYFKKLNFTYFYEFILISNLDSRKLGFDIFPTLGSHWYDKEKSSG